MAAFSGWEAALLQAIGAPVNGSTVAFLDNWQNAEGGSAAFNPLNTTQQAPGSTPYNYAGVQNFVNAAQGIAATAATLNNGYYPDLLAALQSGDPYANVTDNVRSQLNTWGTGSAWISNAGTNTDPFSAVSNIAENAWNGLQAELGGAWSGVTGAIGAGESIVGGLQGIFANPGPLLIGLALLAIGGFMITLSWGESIADSIERFVGNNIARIDGGSAAPAGAASEEGGAAIEAAAL